jgi:hypothetical protein
MTIESQVLNDLLKNSYDWSDQLAKYWDAYVCNYEKLHYNLQAESITINTEKIFKDLLKIFVSHSRFKDEFIVKGSGDVSRPFKKASAISQKNGSIISLGVYMNNFYLESDIERPLYLKNMDDKFWAYFYELSLLGEFRVENQSCFSSDLVEKRLKKIKVVKSNIFKLIRDYVIYYDEEGAVPLNIGTMTLSWNINTSWEDIIKNGLKSFGYMYKINYALYKIEYLRDRRV